MDTPLAGTVTQLAKVEFVQMDSGLLTAAVHILHLLAAATVFGAVIFQFVALHPTLRGLEESQRSTLRTAIAGRWRAVVFAAIAILFFTGLLNFMFALGDLRGHPSAGVYHAMFGVKFLAALAVFHAATMLVLPGPKFDKYRARAGAWLTYMVVLVALIVILAGLLRNFTELFGTLPPAATTQPA
jgi:hypothetical protein